MEAGFRILLLSAVLALPGCAWVRGGEVPETAEADAGESEAVPEVISPQVERRPVKPAKIDTENWEAGAYIGSLSVEDFEVNKVLGGRIAFHISEDFFAEAIFGQSDAGISSYERLSGSAPLLTDSEREFKYWSLGFGWNVLPGEVFLGGSRAYNSAVYLTAGAGSTTFAGDDRFTVTLGAGARLLLTDWLGLHLDIRDHILEVDVVGTNKETHNFEATVSLTAFF
ncbi:MAG: outer membrane beta-barrel domain-containing protein [Steroidobacteraceae bacterium]|jgi:outer membrane beta-barrel protein|nr:outer membrane beta-barrel domain-containing protein [Steroidobacteraceae bacterium]